MNKYINVDSQWMKLGSPGANSLSALVISKFHPYLHFMNIINNLIFAGRMGAVLDKGGWVSRIRRILQRLLAKCGPAEGQSEGRRRSGGGSEGRLGHASSYLAEPELPREKETCPVGGGADL